MYSTSSLLYLGIFLSCEVQFKSIFQAFYLLFLSRDKACCTNVLSHFLCSSPWLMDILRSLRGYICTVMGHTPWSPPIPGTSSGVASFPVARGHWGHCHQERAGLAQVLSPEGSMAQCHGSAVPSWRETSVWMDSCRWPVRGDSWAVLYAQLLPLQAALAREVRWDSGLAMSSIRTPSEPFSKVSGHAPNNFKPMLVWFSTPLSPP